MPVENESLYEDVSELKDNMRELSSDLRQFMTTTMQQLSKFTEIAQAQARNEEKLINMITDQKRLVEDMRQVVKTQGEHASEWKQASYRVEKLEGSQVKLGERFEVTRDSHRDLNMKIYVVGAAFGLIVSPLVALVMNKM